MTQRINGSIAAIPSKPFTTKTPRHQAIIGQFAGAGVIWNGDPLEPPVIPAKAGIHAATMALPLCTSPSGVELLGSDESKLPLDSRFRGNDCLHGPAGKINFPQMTSVQKNEKVFVMGDEHELARLGPVRLAD